jgi:hypothetical protein
VMRDKEKIRNELFLKNGPVQCGGQTSRQAANSTDRSFLFFPKTCDSWELFWYLKLLGTELFSG